MPQEDDTMVSDAPATGVEQNSAPEQSAAPATDTTQATQDTHGESPVEQTAPITQNAESLTTSPQETQPKQEAPGQQVDWSKEGPTLQKRYDDIRADYNRKLNQWQQTYQQQSGQLTELQKFKQEQEQRAQAASLKPWSKLLNGSYRVSTLHYRLNSRPPSRMLS
jgi:hypothetical protein